MRPVRVGDQEVPVARLPIDISAVGDTGGAAPGVLSLPEVGQHNREVLDELGLHELADLIN